jgi:general stress protein 26
MSKLIGDEMTDDLYQRLLGRNLEENAEKVILISTMDENGWPHPAMLSYFEVVAKDRRNLRFATYHNSGTAKNMRRNGKATMSIIDERVAYYLKGDVEELAGKMSCTPHNAKLNLHVRQVLADTANEELEPGAYVASGVTYRNPRRMEQVRTASEIIKELMGD